MYESLNSLLNWKNISSLPNQHLSVIIDSFENDSSNNSHLMSHHHKNERKKVEENQEYIQSQKLQSNEEENQFRVIILGIDKSKEHYLNILRKIIPSFRHHDKKESKVTGEGTEPSQYEHEEMNDHIIYVDINEKLLQIKKEKNMKNIKHEKDLNEKSKDTENCSTDGNEDTSTSSWLMDILYQKMSISSSIKNKRSEKYDEKNIKKINNKMNSKWILIIDDISILIMNGFHPIDIIHDLRQLIHFVTNNHGSVLIKFSEDLMNLHPSYEILMNWILHYSSFIFQVSSLPSSRLSKSIDGQLDISAGPLLDPDYYFNQLSQMQYKLRDNNVQFWIKGSIASKTH